MSINNTLIFSYRPLNAQSSVFLNILDIEKETSLSKVVEVYRGVLRNVFAYDVDHFDTLKKIEQRLKSRIKLLSQKDAGSLFWRVLITVCSLGLFWIFEAKKRSQLKGYENSFQEHFKKLESKKGPKIDAPFQETIRLLKLKQKKDIFEELARLKKDPEINSKFDALDAAYPTSCAINQLVTYGHSLELQKELSKTHYVLNHGLNSTLVGLNILASELTKKFSQVRAQDGSVLRHESLFKHYDKLKHDVDWFKAHLPKHAFYGSGYLSDHDFRKELICCDIDLQNKEAYESALDFYLRSQNIALGIHGQKFITDLIENLLEDFFPLDEQATKRQKLLTEIIELFQTLPITAQGHGLYSICIPKERFHEVAYIARPFGYVYPKEISEKELELIQAGTSFFKYDRTPQARVLAHKLDMSKGDFIVSHSVHESFEIDIAERLQELLDKYFLNLADC
jgi:hypothetical protein